MRNIREHRQPQTSGYDTLFGASPLARAMTQTQAAKISEGSTLEKVVVDKASFVLDLSVSENLTLLLSASLPILDKPYVVCKTHVKKFLWPALVSHKVQNWEELTKTQQQEIMQKHFGHEPDMLLIDMHEKNMTLVELKSFCVFDTEKSSAIAHKIKTMPQKYDLPYKKRGLVVSFYAESKPQIVEGMKKRVKEESVMTGKEFLDVISKSSVNSVMELTQGCHTDNVMFVLEQALESALSHPKHLKEVLEKFPQIREMLQS